MRAGLLDQKVDLYAPASTAGDAMGQAIVTYPGTATATVWAQVEPLTGRELEAAQGTSSEISLKVILRYYSGLTTHWRLVHGAKTYQVLAVLNLMSGKKDLKLLCKELPATAV